MGQGCAWHESAPGSRATDGGTEMQSAKFGISTQAALLWMMMEPSWPLGLQADAKTKGAQGNPCLVSSFGFSRD